MVNKQSIKENLEFQLYDWLEGHEKKVDEDGECDDEEDLPGDFIIHSFGRCDDGKSVYAKIIGYTPYFYFLLPNKLQSKPKTYLEDIIKKTEYFLKGKENKKVFYKFRATLKEIQLVKLKRAEGFTNNKEFWFGRLVFDNADGMKKYKTFMENNEITIPCVPELAKPTKFRLYEANLPPMLRCFHIREISGCSWVQTDKYDLIENEDEKESRCDIEIRVDWRNLNPIKKDHNAPFRICSFDIECNSIDGEFPQAKRKGDSVIQIGATYTYIGKSVPYRQYIACLNQTNPVENTIVESCETEQELMLRFLDEINGNDCDIITGYNIFFFDEKYMFDRCKEVLNIDIDMSYMSKLKNHKCNFKEMKLASSALGENLLRFWDTPGRIHIDLMKDIQKTFNLPSYKLDYVASKFIRGEVSNYKVLGNDKFELQCKAVNDILPGDYVHLEVIKGFVSDEVGEKYLVLEVDVPNKKIIVRGDDFLASELDTAKQGGVINWSQAKDDVGPKDIFRLQKGSADDRAIVAKYCVKDCKLVNLLMNKLEVVTKNLEMANVCFVPLSYLFIRGQGIKLFSLCLREFRKHKYAFPVLKVSKMYRCGKCSLEYLDKWDCPKCKSKKREEVESESSSYEGAIVFDPVPKVDYEALATKDYMSLYPASIMHKNMSHETMVEDSEFDNLPGVKYYNAQFKESDGSIQYRRFAQVEGKLGVIPTILDNLLKERKAVKKQMAKETDPFKAKILDAKQLAVKITANSLYGQLGASTSPVCKRDIAACTTSTGREMLILAKRYDEEFLPWIMNGLKHFYKNGEQDKVDHLFDLELKARNDEELIKDIKKYVEQDIGMLTFQPVIRYGDSVIGDTPLLLRNPKTGNIYIESMKNLVKSKNYHKMNRTNTIDDKESAELSDIETWTEKGWTKIQRVLRHKLAKNKKLFRITTHSGSVVVTDDHSLLTKEGVEVKPKNVKIGTKLLHSFPEINNNKEYIFYNGVKLNTEIAQFLGMFMGDGSCGFYHCDSGDKASFAINNASVEVINKYKNIGNKYFTDFEWKDLPTLESSGVYKLTPMNKKQEGIKTYGNLKKFVCEIRDLMYTNDSQKKVPEFILNASKDIREAFFVGLYDADGFKTNRGTICEDLYNKNLTEVITDKIRCGSQIDQKGMVSSLGIYTLGKSLGYQVSINNRKDKVKIYRIRFCNKTRKDPDAIKKIEEWTEPEEYVYDLTTDNHHFHAGVGSMIVHNTDSIFSCYRFRENTALVSKSTALKVWKKIVGFARVLIEPFFGPKERAIFNDVFETYYSDDKVINLQLPEPPITLPEPSHHAIILPLEERIKQFVKEYMQESYLPWLWTLAELVEKNYTYMFDIKLTQWAEHQLGKIRLLAEDLYENRKNYLMKPLIEHMAQVFTNKYIMPSDNTISSLANRFNSKSLDCFPWAQEIKLEPTKLQSLCKHLMEKTIKEKWIYSGERKELTKVINSYLSQVIEGQISNPEKVHHYLTDFIGLNKNLDLNSMSDLLIKNLISDQDMGNKFNEEKLNELTVEFIENYNKNNGKKTMDEIMEDFVEKELGLKFDLDKQNHYDKMINFVQTSMRYPDMSQMDEEKHIYYWVQPRWDFDMTDTNKKKLYMIDIYEGGEAITDKRTLDYGMEMGKLSGETIKSRLPFPHDCEYEKTFWPFAILTKKRYVGNKYEFDPKKFKQDFMGIVLKRRDNAPIVKEICGGIIDYLINHRSPQGAKDYTRNCLQKMFEGKYDIKYFLTSKTLKLKESYKDWKKIAHVYLAEKIAKRDPGNTPQSGDRIEFAVIKVPTPTDGTKLLQGDMIETPKFIKENNLELDYLFYLTNQIMNPALQFLELVDSNAINIFKEFIEKYSAPKLKKEKKVKEVKEPKEAKEPKAKRTPKTKELKEQSDTTNSKKAKAKKTKKIEVEKIDDTIGEVYGDEKPVKEKSALDMLIEIKAKKALKNNASHNTHPKKNLVLEIKKFIDEINEFMENNKYSTEIDSSFEELFMNIDKMSKKEKLKSGLKNKSGNKKENKHIEV
jgi:DNA polymerase elongation subunit (family B)